jgi:hypothetical protein
MDSISQAATNIWQLVQKIPPELIVASPVVSTAMGALIKWFDTQNDFVKWLLVLVGSTLVAAGHYLLTTPTADPTIVAVQAALISFGANGYYLALYKPLRSKFLEKVADAEKLNAETKSAIIPAGGLPVKGTEVAPQ